MPQTQVVFYRDEDGAVPILEWLESLSAKALDKCRVKLERLRDLGHELRRPEADYLRDGIYELRVRVGSLNYRMLYFFSRECCRGGFSRPYEREAGPARGHRPRRRGEAPLRRGPASPHASGELSMPGKRPPTSDAIDIMHKRYYEGRPERIAALEEARANDEVARKLLQLRNQAGLSQRELARLVGTTASVICRLEDADYEGHSLSMLRRIAAALDRRVEIRFVPIRRRSSRTGEHGSPAL